MQAVILAGGFGTRLRPLTYKIPKPMVPVNGRPFLEHQLELLKKHEIKDIVLCIGYLGGIIRNYFRDGSKFGLNIEYSIEKTLLGTGGALKNAEKYLNEEFMVLNGDTYLPIDYTDLIRFYEHNNITGVIVVYNDEEGKIPNNISINGSNFVTKYDKKNASGMAYIDAGVQMFKKKVLDLIPENRVVSFEEEIYPKLIEDRRLLAYITKQRFYDMGTPERLKLIETVLI